MTPLSQVRHERGKRKYVYSLVASKDLILFPQKRAIQIKNVGQTK